MLAKKARGACSHGRRVRHGPRGHTPPASCGPGPQPAGRAAPAGGRALAEPGAPVAPRGKGRPPRPGARAPGCLVIRTPPERPASAAREFKNTFAPCVDRDVISVDVVIAGLRYGAIKESDLPGEVHDAVAAELARIKRETISPERALILLLGAVGEVRERTRMQKYTFLADMALYSKKTKRLFTMYEWKPGKSGPHSQILERCMRKAMDKELVEAFPACAPGGKASTGYRLASKGEERLRELRGAFERDIALMGELLEEFRDDRSEDRLAAHVRGTHPGYTTGGAAGEDPEGAR